MTLIEVLVVLAVVAAVAAVAVGAVRGGLDEPASTVPDPGLADSGTDSGADSGADRPLRGADLLDVRFALALRGYRMDQVDEALDRAADAIEERDEQIRRLRERLALSGGDERGDDRVEDDEGRRADVVAREPVRDGREPA